LGIIVIDPNLDAVAETQIESQNYDAEFGWPPPGLGSCRLRPAQTIFTIRPFEFLRNNSPGFQDFLRNPFNKAENSGAPPTKWNQFGGSIGGRISAVDAPARRIERKDFRAGGHLITGGENWELPFGRAKGGVAICPASPTQYSASRGSTASRFTRADAIYSRYRQLQLT
jgi:hypothetical protein